MHFSTTTIGGFGLLATLAAAAPRMGARQASGAETVVYWGQNGGGTIENNDLSAYCGSDSGIDTLVLSFLYEYGNGNLVASGTIGQSCYISPQGEPQQCDDLAAAIDTCKSAGKRIILSLGGAAGAYSLQSQSDAETIGQNLWDAYGNAPNGSVPRPFGSTFVDGWDFDIESNSGNHRRQFLEWMKKGEWSGVEAELDKGDGVALNERDEIRQQALEFLHVDNELTNHPSRRSR